MKILVVRFSSIGDIVLTSGVVRLLRKRFPKAKIHYLTKAAFVPIVKSNPYLDRIHPWGGDGSVSIKELQDEGFTFMVDLHKNLRTLRLSFALNVPVYSFDKANISKWILIKSKGRFVKEIPHIYQRYLVGIEELGIEDDGLGLDYFIPAHEVNPTLIALARQHYTVLVLGGTYYTKRIPINILREIIEKLDGKVVLLGGKAESQLGQDLLLAFPNKVIDFTGKLTLGASAYVVSHSSKVITGDTGMMHIAAAFKKPIISVWGNTVPEFGMYPWFGKENVPANYIAEVKGLSCRPCSKLGYDQCPKGHFRCMLNQDTDAITKLANSLIEPT